MYLMSITKNLFIMIQLILPFILIVIVFIALFLAWYLIRSAKIKERLILIEKGLDPKDIKSIIDQKNHFPWLKIGILITGTSLGGLLVSLLYPAIQSISQFTDNALIFIIILLFAGSSMILANFLGDPKDQK